MFDGANLIVTWIDRIDSEKCIANFYWIQRINTGIVRFAFVISRSSWSNFIRDVSDQWSLGAETVRLWHGPFPIAPNDKQTKLKFYINSFKINQTKIKLRQIKKKEFRASLDFARNSPLWRHSRDKRRRHVQFWRCCVRVHQQRSGVEWAEQSGKRYGWLASNFS